MNCTLEEPTQMALNRLGEALRKLMGDRGLSQVDTAEQVGISETALSLIVNGQNRPRQKTFTKLLNRLATNQQERNFLTDAYLGVEDGDTYAPVGESPMPQTEEPPVSDEEDNDDDERVRPSDSASRYLEVKAQKIAFENDVEHLLHVARIPYIHPYVSDKIACDFVTKTKTKVVIECKVNLNRDWDRLLGQCILLRDNLPAKQVVIVIPYHNKISQLYAPDFHRQGFHIETPSSLIARLKKEGV
jgi:transcriptional regulator with XRE-family HTH domain